MTDDPGLGWFIGLGGLVTAFAVAGLLQGVTSDVGSSNVALLLAVVVVVAGILGERRGGIVTALSAALSYNFFHTRPIHTLRIAEARDVVTVCLLALIGVIVGELSRRRTQAVERARGRRAQLVLLRDNAEVCGAMRSVNEAVFSATATVAELLDADGVWFERGSGDDGSPQRRITPSGTVEGVALRVGDDGLELGPDPVTLTVGSGERTFGRLVIAPRAGHGVPIDARVGAVIVARQLAMGLSTTTYPLPTAPVGRDN